MIGVQSFVNSCSCVRNPYAQLHHFFWGGGGKICGIDVLLNATNGGLWQMGVKYTVRTHIVRMSNGTFCIHGPQ